MKYIIAFISFFIPVIAFAQNPQIVYSYDASGNRIQRKTIVLGTEDPLPPTPSSNKVATNQTTTGIKDSIGKFNVSFYPNPIENYVNVKFDVNTNLSHAKLKVLDMRGIVLIEENNLSTITKLNFQSLAAGQYIIWIEVDGQMKEWGVIKIKN